MREALELRVSRRLWDVVPPVRQKPSEYRTFLTNSVFIDFWGAFNATEARRFLEVVKAVGGGQLSCYIGLQHWEVGGWDALRPAPIRLPDYPPAPPAGCQLSWRSGWWRATKG